MGGKLLSDFLHIRTIVRVRQQRIATDLVREARSRSGSTLTTMARTLEPNGAVPTVPGTLA